MRKEKFLEMQKHLGGSFEDAKVIANFINRLTPEGFEQYVADFFKQESYGFHTVRNGGMNDKGIDVKAARTNADWSKTFLIVQCKKWEAYHIKENDLAMFYGKVVDIAHEHDCLIIFVATTWFTPWAKEFCKEKNIMYADYKKLLEFDEEYPLLDWIDEMQARSDKTKYLTEWNPWDTGGTTSSYGKGKYKSRGYSTKGEQSGISFKKLALAALIAVIAIAFLATLR